MAEPLPELDLGQRTAALQRTLAEETQRGLDLHRSWVEGLPLPIPSSQPTIDERVSDYLANFQRSAEAEAQRTAQRRANERRWAEEARSLYTPPSPDVVARQQMEASELEQIARATRQRNFSLAQDDVFNRYHPNGTDYEAQQQRDLSSQIERARRNNRDRAASAGSGGGYDGTPNDPPSPPRTPDSSGFSPASIDRSPSLRTQQTSGTRAPLDFADPPRTGLPASGWNVLPNPPSPPIAAQPQTYRPQRLQNLRPSNVPRPMGLGQLARGSAIGGLLDFGIQVGMGQDPRRAAASATGGAIGSTVGASIGASIGALFGGVGAIPGGIIGGFIGGVAGGLGGEGLYNSLFPSSLPANIPERNFTLVPFRGGQGVGVAYRVTVQVQGEASPRVIDTTGAIVGVRQVQTTYGPNQFGVYSYETTLQLVAGSGSRVHGLGSASSSTGFPSRSGSIVSVVRRDGQADNDGDRYEPAPMVLIPVGRAHPANDPHENYIPSTADNIQNGQGNSPFWIPANRPAPGITPVGDPTPRPIPQTQPTPGTGGRTVTPQAPHQSSIPTPQSRTTTFTIPAPESRHPDDTAPDNQLFPPALPALAPTVRPTPQPQPQPSSIPPTTPPNVSDPCQGNACSQAIRSDIANNRSRLDELNAALNAADLLGLADLQAKLDRIDNKLGAQVPGGLSGFLQGFREKFDKFVKWTQIDRVLNLLTFITAVHNAFMLSNQIGQTLASAISQGLAVIGIRDEDGNELDVNSIIGTAVENAIKSIIGEENYETMSAQWKRANRIYQSAANILFSLQSITYSILESMEVIGSYIAKIGNAAKKFGVFAENCYAWMNPNPDFTQNRFFRFMNNTQEAVENIDEVAGEVLNIQETVTEVGNQSQQLRQAVAGIDENGQPYPTGLEVPEHSPTFDVEIANSESSQSPPISESDERAPVEAGAS